MIRHSFPERGNVARTSWPEQPRTRRVAPSPATNYQAAYEELAGEVSPEHKQAIAGGLREHSVGDVYPKATVYIANGDSGHWEVHNLMTGKRLYNFRDAAQPWRGHGLEAVHVSHVVDSKKDNEYWGWK